MISPLNPQTGTNLGERMSNAFTEALQSSKYALIIGTDCPALTVKHLNQTFEKLNTDFDVVIGPAEDGGYVLIGVRKANKVLFENINWGTEQVFEQTMFNLSMLKWKSYLLDELWDIDTPEDLHRLPENYLKHIHLT